LAVDEEVEAAVGDGAAEPGYVVDELHGRVAAGAVDTDGVPDEVLRTRERGGRGGLAHGGGAGGGLGLERVDRGHQVRRAHPVPDAPPGHRVRLGDAVGEEHPLGQPGFDGRQGRGVLVAVPDLVVDLVGEDADVGVFQQHLCQRVQFTGGVGGSGGIARGVEDDPARALGDRRREPLRCQLEAVRLGAVDDHRGAVVGADHVGIGDPVRGGDDDLVPFVQGGHQGEEDDLLGSAADGDPRVGELQAVALTEFPGDRGAQGRGAVHGGVLGLTRLDGPDRGGLDVVGSVEVGLAHGQVEDGEPLALEFAHALRRRRAGRGVDTAHPLRGVRTVCRVHVISLPGARS
jgi:hypothetical protein